MIGGIVLAALVVTAAPAGAGPTKFGKADVTTGVFQGRPWVKVALDEPFPLPDEKPSAAVAFSVFTPEGVHISGFNQIHRGQASAQGVFAADSTVNPRTPAPVEVRLSPDRKTVTFFLDDPEGVTLDPKTLRYRVQLYCQEIPSGPVVTTSHPEDGQPAKFRSKKEDPEKRTTAKAPPRKNPAKKKQ